MDKNELSEKAEIALKLAVKKMVDSLRDIANMGVTPQFATQFRFHGGWGNDIKFQLTLEPLDELSPNIPEGYKAEHDHSSDMKAFVDDINKGVPPEEAGKPDWDIKDL